MSIVLGIIHNIEIRNFQHWILLKRGSFYPKRQKHSIFPRGVNTWQNDKHQHRTTVEA
jgi:hypothetical protein